VEIMAMYSGFYDNNFLSSTFGGGIRKYRTALTMFRRVGLDNVATISHSKKLPYGLETQIKSDFAIHNSIQSKA
jgi:hypothetical protein